MIKTFKYIALICTSSILMMSCGGNNAEEKKAEMGPEAVVEAFNRAVAAGDFDAARSLCDTVAMRDYLDSYIEAWETLQKEDSSALAIASAILSDSVLETGKVEKDGDCRVVYYTLEADGNRKERKATVKKDEGEWKVQEITDAI